MNRFYKYYNKKLLETELEKKEASKELIDKLMKVPKKEKIFPKHQTSDKDIINQIDILYLPEDDGYKYALVVVDVFSRITDAEPLKNKRPKDVLEAINKIYNRNYLNKPKYIQVDSGTEFKGEFLKWIKKNKITLRKAKEGRHRQQAVVEGANSRIVSSLFTRMNMEELITGEKSVKWVDLLEDVIEGINNKEKKKLKSRKKEFEKNIFPVCKADNCILLNEGDKVRVKLDYPIDITTGNKLHGNFRKSDIRWSLEIREIERVALTPASPPLYFLKGDDPPVPYTKEQLQVVEKGDKLEPEGKLLYKDREEPKKINVKEIKNKKKIKGKIYYLIRWYGYPDEEDYTYEPRSELIKNVKIKKMIQDFEKNN